MLLRSKIGLGALMVAAGCGSGEQSIALIFPNDAARSATMRVVIEAHSPDTGTASTNDRDCMSFLGAAREGRPIQGAAVRGDYPFPFAADQELTQVPPGRQIIYVTGYASREDEAPPILEGCTSDYDSKGGSDEHVEVEVRLEVVVPLSARLVKAQGDRQVGREGENLPVPLKVRVEAESPMNSRSYVIPGVSVQYASSTEGFTLEGGSGGSEVEAYTDARGEASVVVKLPPMSGTGEIVAVAPALDDPEKEDTDRYTQKFSVSVTEPVLLTPSATINGGDIPISVALGQITGSTDLELVILSCNGSEKACTPGSRAMMDPGYGQSRLTVFTNLAGDPASYPVTPPAGGFGILPADVAVTDLIGPDVNTDEIAYVNSRRADCQNRTCTPGQPCQCYGVGDNGACPCEGSELLVLRDTGSAITLQTRQTLTASNAIALAPYVLAGARYKNLAISAQGRAKNTRPCSLQTQCRANSGARCDEHPEECGCPAEELCECGGCTTTTEPGFCVARDKVVDLMLNRWNEGLGVGDCSQANPNGSCGGDPAQICYRGTCVARAMIPKNDGCQSPAISCDKADVEASTCVCEQSNVMMCGAVDFCGCNVPERVHVGNPHTPRFPFSITAGEIDESDDWDIIVPSDGGLELIEARPTQKSFEWTSAPTLNAPIHDAVIVQLDTASDQAGDVVWISKEKCLRGANPERACPLFRELPDGMEAKGCAGAFYTNRRNSLFELASPTEGGCQRYELTFSPDSMCTGDFNGDGAIDMAMASDEENKVFVMSGDGYGGLLDPPDEFPIPGGALGGPIACGKIDGDAKDDVVVVSRNSGDAYVLRTAP